MKSALLRILVTPDLHIRSGACQGGLAFILYLPRPAQCLYQ